MAFPSSKLRARSTLIALIGAVCVALVLMIGIVQVVHTHPSGHPDPDCALCVAAHQAVEIIAVVTVIIFTRPVEHLLLEPDRRLPRSTYFFRLDCRPPPTDSALAA